MKIQFLLLASVVWFAGCSGTKSSLDTGRFDNGALFIPAGVDSAVAAVADSLARESFVSIPDQEEAQVQKLEGMDISAWSDSLWRYLEMSQDSSGQVDAGSAESALRAANKAVGPLNELIQLTRTTDLDSLTMLRRQEALLDQAQSALEEAIQLNPFDLQTQTVLARVYTAQAQRLGKSRSFQESIDVLEKLTRLRPDQHNLFIALANNYYQTKKWNEAAYNYEKAEQVYLNTYDLVASDAPPEADSLLLYQYVSRQADVHVLRRDAGAAITAYNRALVLAPDQSEEDFIRGEMNWIDWDGGNLSSSFARDSLIELEQSNLLPEAERGYERLLRDVQKPTAVDETEWRLASVQYKMGKGEEAADRLLQLLRRTAVTDEGMPVDSTYARYFDTFGTICFNQAMLFLGERRDNRTALKYLEQAVQFPWNGRPRAYLESAKLLRSNVKIAKERAHDAMTEINLLSPDDQKELYGLLATFYRTEGNFEEARKYLERYRSM